MPCRAGAHPRPARGGTAASWCSVLGLHALAARGRPGRSAGSSAGSSTTVTQPGQPSRPSTGSPIGLAVAVVAQTVLTWVARRSSFILGETVFAELREQFIGPRGQPAAVDRRARRHRRPRGSRTTNDVEALSHVVRFGIPSLFVAVDDGADDRRGGAVTSPLAALPILVGLPLLWFSTRSVPRHAPDGYLRERATYARAQRRRRRDGRRRAHRSTRCRSAGGAAAGSTTPCASAYDAEMLHPRPAAALVPAGRVRLLRARSPWRCSGVAGW